MKQKEKYDENETNFHLTFFCIFIVKFKDLSFYFLATYAKSNLHTPTYVNILGGWEKYVIFLKMWPLPSLQFHFIIPSVIFYFAYFFYIFSTLVPYRTAYPPEWSRNGGGQ